MRVGIMGVFDKFYSGRGSCSLSRLFLLSFLFRLLRRFAQATAFGMKFASTGWRAWFKAATQTILDELDDEGSEHSKASAVSVLAAGWRAGGLIFAGRSACVLIGAFVRLHALTCVLARRLALRCLVICSLAAGRTKPPSRRRPTHTRWTTPASRAAVAAPWSRSSAPRPRRVFFGVGGCGHEENEHVCCW